MEGLLIEAFVLGLIGGVIPGPVLTAVFTEVLQGSFLKSLKIVLLAFAAESAVALLSMVLFTNMGFPEGVFKAISLVGAGILIWISTALWKVTSIESGDKLQFSFWKILVMILANGMLWTYWITICIPKAMKLGDSLMGGEYYFLTLVEVGWLITTTLTAFIFAQFRSLLSKPSVIPYLFKFFAVVFVYFALSLLYDSYDYFSSFINGS